MKRVVLRITNKETEKTEAYICSTFNYRTGDLYIDGHQSGEWFEYWFNLDEWEIDFISFVDFDGIAGNYIYFREYPGNINGLEYMLYPLNEATKGEIAKAKKWLKDNKDPIKIRIRRI